jgi:hypothetical protein
MCARCWRPMPVRRAECDAWAEHVGILLTSQFCCPHQHRMPSGQRKTSRPQPIALRFISTITVSLIRRVWHGLMVVVIANGTGVAQISESRLPHRIRQPRCLQLRALQGPALACRCRSRSRLSASQHDGGAGRKRADGEIRGWLSHRMPWLRQAI